MSDAEDMSNFSDDDSKKRKRTSAKECAVYDATLPADNISVDDLHSLLRPLCKKWSFQLERGAKKTEKHPEGYLHYQLRLSLVKKKTLKSALAFLLAGGFKGHLTTSSTNSLTGDAFYVLKADTRVDGPWTDKDYVPRNALTQQLQLCPTYLPWQQSLLDIVAPFDMRTIH